MDFFNKPIKVAVAMTNAKKSKAEMAEAASISVSKSICFPWLGTAGLASEKWTVFLSGLFHLAHFETFLELRWAQITAKRMFPAAIIEHLYVINNGSLS